MNDSAIEAYAGKRGEHGFREEILSWKEEAGGTLHMPPARALLKVLN